MRTSLISSLALILALASASPAHAADTKKYKNCAAVNKVYSHGIAKKGYKEQGGALTGTPYVNSKLYAINQGRDRDRDGVACER